MATKSPIIAPTPNVAFENDELLALARLDLERGNVEEALKKLKSILAQAAPMPDALAMAGRVYAQLGLWERAKDLFQKFLKANPQALTEAFQLGMVHYDAGQADEALKIWADILKQHPVHPPALFYTALAHAQSNRANEARQQIDVLLKSAPPDNLYFGRAKELLRALDTQQPLPAPPAVDAGSKKPMPAFPAGKDAYKTEH